jgi:hypothetical protein
MTSLTSSHLKSDALLALLMWRVLALQPSLVEPACEVYGFAAVCGGGVLTRLNLSLAECADVLVEHGSSSLASEAPKGRVAGRG